MDVYTEIQNELWAERQGIAAGKLTVSQIAEAFPDEAPALCRRHIRRLSREINQYLNFVRIVKSGAQNHIEEMIGIEDAKMFFPGGHQRLNVIAEHKRVLKSVLACVAVKESGNQGNFEGISQVDVDFARNVDIEGLEDWEKPKRFGGRFQACCPFHVEQSGSFFIFKDNRFKCFGCGAHGDAIEFVMRKYSIEFIDAVKRLKGGV